MAAVAEPSLTLSFEEARHLVEEHAARLRPRGKELLDLLDSAGRILAESVGGGGDFRQFPRAPREGSAVRAADLARLPATLEVIGEIKAGAALEKSAIKLEPGQAAAIMTGAPAPPGADAVVMVEYTSPQGDQVEITKAVVTGENIVAAGSEAKRGVRLLSPGVRLDHAAIAASASGGRSHLLLYGQPQVAAPPTRGPAVGLSVLPRWIPTRYFTQHSPS